MGKGDKKTRRGKIVRKTYGVRRRRKNKPVVAMIKEVSKTTAPITETKPVKPGPKKPAPKKTSTAKAASEEKPKKPGKKTATAKE